MRKFKKVKQLSILILITVIKLQSQSFNILDERIKLKDHNYNLSENQSNPFNTLVEESHIKLGSFLLT